MSQVTAASVYAANLAWAAEQATQAGVKLVIEPINHRDMPGYFLNTEAQGAAVVEAIGRDRLGLQFDVYHCQTTEGDITKRMEQFMPVIAHMQIADVPARNEPGTGEIGWGFVFRRMDELGYRGWVGCEYRPAGDTVAGLKWRAGIRRLTAQTDSSTGRTTHEDRIHRPRHHGPPHGAQPARTRGTYADRAGAQHR